MYKQLMKHLFCFMVMMVVGMPLGATENAPASYDTDSYVGYKSTNTQRIEVVSVTDSDNDGNVGSNVNDGDLDTRWSSKDVNPYIILTLEQEAQVENILIASYVGDTRLAYFSIEVSDDGSNWTHIDSYVTSGLTNDLQTFTVNSDVISYVKIIGGGNSNSRWSSITEVEIWGVPSNGGVSDPNIDNGPVDGGPGNEPVDVAPGINTGAGGDEGGGCFINSMQFDSKG